MKIVGALLDTAYFAGLFDGEGSFRISKGGGPPSRMCSTTESSMTLYVQVVNTYKPVLEELRDLYGGGIYENKANRGHGWKPAWAWVCSGKKAAKFTHDVFPFLRIKKEQAQACLMFAETYHKPWREFRYNGLTKEAVKLRNLSFKAFRQATEKRTARGLTWQLS